MLLRVKIEINQEKLAAGSDWLEETQTEKLLRVDTDRKQEKSQLVARHDNVKTTIEYQPWRCEDSQKLWHPFRGSSDKGVSHPLQSWEDETCEQARARTATGNKSCIIKICLLYLFSWCFIYICLAKKVALFILCFCLLDENRYLH